MFGFSKLFVIVLFIAFIIGYGSKNIYNALMFIGVYASIKIVWNILR